MSSRPDLYRVDIWSDAISFRLTPILELYTEEVSWPLPTIVGVETCAKMVVAATVGTITPLLFKCINVDPAIATGPFVTITIDVLGILSYFGLA